MLTKTLLTAAAPETLAIRDLLIRAEYASLALNGTWDHEYARRLAKLIERYSNRAKEIAKDLKIPHYAFEYYRPLVAMPNTAMRQARTIARSNGVDVHNDYWLTQPR